MTVTILIPYVLGMLHDRTRAWWESPRRGDEQLPCLAELPAGDDTAYWQLLADYWPETDPVQHDPYEAPDVPDLVIVEQDIVPAPGVVEAMLGCDRPWCVSPYPIAHGRLLDEGLGCTKLGVQLKVQHPDLMERVGRIDDDGMPARDWHRLDTRIAHVLRELGYAPHRHGPSEHLHDYARRP